LSDSIEEVLKHASDRDTLHRWLDDQPSGARILIIAVISEETKDVYRYCCSDDLMVHESNWMIDVYKRYLQDSTENP
jgi:hypothetical protein